jgi:hypothetical protein
MREHTQDLGSVIWEHLVDRLRDHGRTVHVPYVSVSGRDAQDD